MGGLPRDYLFPDNFLIVEGESDKIFIEGIINKYYSHKKSKIQVVSARGVSKVNCVRYFLESFIKAGPYQNSAIILTDKRNEGNKQHYERIYNEIVDRLCELDKSDLELYYPDKYHTFLDTKEVNMIGMLKDSKKFDSHSKDANMMKCSIAKKMSERITKEEFETLMPICHKALLKCFEPVANPKKESHDIKTPENTKSRKKRDDDMSVEQMDFLK